MHFFASVVCFVLSRSAFLCGEATFVTTQSAERVGYWSMMQPVHRLSLIQPFCLVTQRFFPSRDTTKIAEMESDLLAMLIKGDYSFRGTHSLLGYHKYH